MTYMNVLINANLHIFHAFSVRSIFALISNGVMCLRNDYIDLNYVISPRKSVVIYREILFAKRYLFKVKISEKQ